MRKILWLLFTFLFCSVISVSAQKNRAKLFFKDSTNLVGLAKITKSDKIIFRKDAKSKKQTYSGLDVYEVHIKEKGYYKRYFYKTNYETGQVLLLQLIKDGTVRLFGDIRKYTTPVNNGVGMTGTFKQTKETYYLGDAGDLRVVNVKRGNTYLKNFLKIAKIYFMDCPDLITSIEGKEFSKFGIRDVVEYYNSYCR